MLKQCITYKQLQKFTVMIRRYSKQTMHSRVIARVRPEKQAEYEAKFKIMPYHHLLMTNEVALAYIWDTRYIEVMVPLKDLVQDDLTYAVIDNRLDIKVKTYEAEPAIVQYCEAHREDMPIQLIDNEEDAKHSAYIDQTQLA